MPQDIDALLNAYHSKRGTQRAPAGVPESSDSSTAPIPAGPSSLTDEALDFAKGAGKGAVGLGVGAGQLARGAESNVLGTHLLENIGKSSLGQDIAGWAMAPSKSWSESAGHWVGETAPFLIGGPEGLILRGALAGGLQPTEEGTITSHLPGAVTGGVLGAIPGMGSKGLQALSWAAKTAGIPLPNMSKLIHALNWLQNNQMLQQVAGKGAVTRGAVTGTAAPAGQAIGQQGNVYEEDYQPRYRPAQ